jgi:hypothetical protein
LLDTYERIRADHLLRLRRQSIKPIAQINRMAGEKDLRARRQTDHSVLRIARKTRDSAFSFTRPSTQMRTPFGNAISIVPDPPSMAWDGCDRSGSDGTNKGRLSPLTSPTTPSRTNSTGSDTLTAAAATFRAERQLYSRLSEMPCRRATNATLPPSDSTSSSSADFWATLHFRRRVMISPSDTSPPSGALQKEAPQEQTIQMSRTSAQYGAGHALTVLSMFSEKQMHPRR